MLKDYWLYIFSRRKLAFRLLGKETVDHRQHPLLLFWNVPVLEDLFYPILMWLAAYGAFRRDPALLLSAVAALLCGSFLFCLVFRRQAKKEEWRTILFHTRLAPGAPDRGQLFRFRCMSCGYLVLPDKTGTGYVLASCRRGEIIAANFAWFVFFFSAYLGKDLPVSGLPLALSCVGVFSLLVRFTVFFLPRNWRLINHG